MNKSAIRSNFIQIIRTILCEPRINIKEMKLWQLCIESPT